MTTAQQLDDRYGLTRTRSGRIVRWSVVGAVALALIGWLVYTSLSNSLGAVTANGVSFTINDEHSIDVGFQVTGPTGKPYACVVEAQDSEYGVVGWKVVELPASDAQTRAFTEKVPTLGLATTGFVNSCWVA